jgi:hypothetical protein
VRAGQSETVSRTGGHNPLVAFRRFVFPSGDDLQADYAIELGSEDETLELPWAAPEGGPRYYDLKRHPETLADVEEATCHVELKDFLTMINSPTSILETAKCDAWGTREINPAEEAFGAAWKFGSYVDLVFSNNDARYSFSFHDEFVKTLTTLMKRTPEIPAEAELLLRRCYFLDKDNVRDGYYVTFYLFGYGPDEMKARLQWGIALKLAGNAILQCSSR